MDGKVNSDMEFTISLEKKYFNPKSLDQDPNNALWKTWERRSDDGVTTSLQLIRNSRPPMLDHQDKYMMKAQSKLIGPSDRNDKVISGEKDGSTANLVSTARPEVNTASVPVNVSAATPSTPPTTTIFSDEDLTIAQTLIKLRSKKAEEKGIAFKDADDSTRPIRSITTLQPLLTIDPKDKELDRAQKEKQKQEKATISTLTKEFDEIQPRMDVNHELAVRMTHEEQEKYTIKERARLLAEYYERKKETISSRKSKGNKEQTTYKNSSHEQNDYKLYQKEQKWINDFVPIDSEKEEKKSVEPESKGKKGKRIKRFAESALKQKSSKRQKMMQEQESAKSDKEESAGYEHEKEELRMWLTVVSDEEESVDLEILSTKEKRYPLIKEMLEKMLNSKLEVEAESTMEFELLKFINLGLKSHVEEATATTNLEWCQLDDLIKMWILGSLCDSLQEQVVTTPGNAKALWVHLKDLFHDNNDARDINLDNELRSIKIGKMTVKEYCTKIKSMANRLKNLDCQATTLPSAFSTMTLQDPT
nr:hybrid signal transduction histidine kinase M [Tanacetum cinerariifolium]